MWRGVDARGRATAGATGGVGRAVSSACARVVVVVVVVVVV